LRLEDGTAQHVRDGGLHFQDILRDRRHLRGSGLLSLEQKRGMFIGLGFT
jgi:hypothetical protein